jgi:transcription-repair coupling factor (superfamily II helicase)
LELQDLIKKFETHSGKLSLEKYINSNENFKLHLSSVIESGLAVVVAAANFKNSHNLFLLNDKEEAAYFYNDLCALLGEETVMFFPSSYKRSAQYQKTDNSNIVLRTECLNKIADGKEKLHIISYPEAINEKIISKKQIQSSKLNLKINQEISISDLEEKLIEMDFVRSDFVNEPGQYSVRGYIVDVFSYSDEQPYRIDFFGNEIESIRKFDLLNQLSIESLANVSIVQNIKDKVVETERQSFFKFFENKINVWCKDIRFCADRIEKVYQATKEKYSYIEVGESKQDISSILLNSREFIDEIETENTIEFYQKYYSNYTEEISLNQSPQPSFNKNFDIVSDFLISNDQSGFSNIILSSNPRQIDRIRNIFEDKQVDVKFEGLNNTLHSGFIDNDTQVCCLTDHQIFDRFHRFKLKNSGIHKAKENVSIKEISQLNPGDYIVHSDHGIGRFGGLQTIDVNGKNQEAIRLVFRDNDILFVSLHSLHKISKYKGKEGSAPRINKLGTATWQKLKDKTKKKIKDIAKDLIQLYAKRKAEKGFAFSPDTYMQHELEASFIYEDTPDQEKATKAVKEGMESSTPMDRLVCGDVGFGKTEIAIRAAFKAVCDNKQVAILVPTTILAFQHYQTLINRLSKFPCNIDYLSRMRKPKDQKRVIKELADGKIDIVVGTHKLIGKEIKFKDLGLLIVDEEQKFGVAVKEKLKSIKVNVDTLTLTATPIPRTLQFSLMGARDLSIIKTPPPNRYPIITELHSFNEDIIREAISYEIERNGQVFFIHNRVQNLFEIEALISKLVPGIKTVSAHGQMEGPKLEKIMLDFIRGDYDVLIATTIIESGLDIPNANTIIINNAQNFGLSELHQLRGRVGRSNKKAFCYLLSPPLESINQEARQRLRAIEDFSELGSGFNIAMQDLDIRGAGNLLGGEQSGFIADIGYETYHRILNEAMLELKEGEFKHVFEKEENNKDKQVYVVDCNIDTDLEILFPEYYIESISERISLYRELDNIADEESLSKFEEKLVDRFGEIPPPSIELLNGVRLRWKAVNIGVEKLLIKSNKMVLYFVANQQSSYYQSPQFMNVLKYLQNQDRKCSMKEKNNRLSLSFPKVKSCQEAYDILNDLEIS